MRDMIGEVTDWFVLNHYKTNHPESNLDEHDNVKLFKKSSVC